MCKSKADLSSQWTLYNSKFHRDWYFIQFRCWVWYSNESRRVYSDQVWNEISSVDKELKRKQQCGDIATAVEKPRNIIATNDWHRTFGQFIGQVQECLTQFCMKMRSDAEWRHTNTSVWSKKRNSSSVLRLSIARHFFLIQLCGIILIKMWLLHI